MPRFRLPPAQRRPLPPVRYQTSVYLVEVELNPVDEILLGRDEDTAQHLPEHIVE